MSLRSVRSYRVLSPVLVLLAVMLAEASVVTAADWPQFRGPRGDGTSEAAELPTRWGGFYEPTWQAAIPGRGWSSPIVIGDRIWLT